MKDAAGVVVVDVPAVLIDAPAGVVEHRWLPPHTADSGDFYAEFQVIYPDARIETFPNNSNIPIDITPDIA